MKVIRFFQIILFFSLINVLPLTSLAATKAPDLSIKAIYPIPTVPCINKDFQILIQVRNLGNAVAPPSVVGVRVGGGRIQTFQLDSINPYKVESIYVENVKLSLAMEYLVTAWVDYHKKINENRENNNRKRIRLKVIRGCPDLVISGIRLDPRNPTINTRTKLYVKVRNKGSCSSIEATLVIKLNGTIYPLSPPGSMWALHPNSSQQCARIIRFKKKGNNHIKAIIDSPNRIYECNERNNMRAIQVWVKAPAPPPPPPQRPDLVVSSVKLVPRTHLRSRTAITFQITVKNIGTARANTSVLWVSIGRSMHIKEKAIRALAPGNVCSVTVKGFLSAAQTYPLLITADKNNQVEEINEMNNNKVLDPNLKK